MSAATPAPYAAPPAARQAAGEACPLCGAELGPEQDWCLRCGSAARTRLAPSPNWKAPVAVLVAAAVISAAVLAAALVKLAGSSSSGSAGASTATPTAPATTPGALPTLRKRRATPSAGARARGEGLAIPAK